MSDRTIRLGLAASLALNLFLAGLIAGAAMLGTRLRERPPPRSESIDAVRQSLDPEDADRLTAALRRTARDNAPRVRALRAARREAEAAMKHPAYNPVAVGAAIARARTEELALRQAVDRTLIDFAGTLDPGERAALAPLLRRGRGGRPQHGRPGVSPRSSGPAGQGADAGAPSRATNGP